MENDRKQRDIRLVTTDKSYFVSKSNYHGAEWFSGNLLAIEMIKTKLKMNKPIYWGPSVLEISKTVMFAGWYNYVKPTY